MPTFGVGELGMGNGQRAASCHRPTFPWYCGVFIPIITDARIIKIDQEVREL